MTRMLGYMGWLLAVLLLATPAIATDLILPNGGGSLSFKPNTTFLDQRYREVIRQQRDFSCGSAALATLLKYHYGRRLNEAEVLEAMFRVGDRQKILRQGFSMLDMKRYLGSIGLRADGFRAPLEKLTRVGIPAIVLLNLNNYLHFVVVRGLRDDKVLIADPAYGNRVMTREAFMESWNQILFVVLNDMERGKRHFNTAANWHYRHQAAFERYTPITNLGLSTLTAQRLNGYF